MQSRLKAFLHLKWSAALRSAVLRQLEGQVLVLVDHQMVEKFCRRLRPLLLRLLRSKASLHLDLPLQSLKM